MKPLILYRFTGQKNIGTKTKSTVWTFCRLMSYIAAVGDKTYQDALKDLDQLESIRRTSHLAKFRNPQDFYSLFKRHLTLAGLETSDLDKLNVIHVAGTKGKGSTCAFIESILRTNGLKTGFFSSPHLVEVNERIRINGSPLSDDQFGHYFYQTYDRLVQQCEELNLPKPTYVTMLAIMAFDVFLEEKVDSAIIEVGVGGEFDPTNVIQKPIVCGITTLDYDHIPILGSTIEEIARNKARICKPNVPLFTVSQYYEQTYPVIREEAARTSSPLFICKPLINLQSFKLGIKGTAQLWNASLASQLARYFLDNKTNSQKSEKMEFYKKPETSLQTDFLDLPESFQTGLMNTCWPGRCQTIEIDENQTLYLDGAHTEKSMENCIDWFLNQSHCNSYKILMTTIIGERNREKILMPIIRCNQFDEIIFSTVYMDSLELKKRTDKNQQHGFGSIDNMDMTARAWQSLVENLQMDTQMVNHHKIPFVVDCFKHFDELKLRLPNRKIDVLVAGSLHHVGTVLLYLRSRGFQV